PERQAYDGHVDGAGGGVVETAAALCGLSWHWTLTGDAQLAEELVGPVAKAGHWLDKARRRGGHEPRSLWWAIAAWRAGAAMLRATGQPDVADDFDAFATAARDEAEVDARGPGDLVVTALGDVADLADLTGLADL